VIAIQNAQMSLYDVLSLSYFIVSECFVFSEWTKWMLQVIG